MDEHQRGCTVVTDICRSNNDVDENELNVGKGKCHLSVCQQPDVNKNGDDVADNDDDVADDDDDVETSHPVDRGWAWMILIGATLVMTILIGIMKSSGIFFVAIQQHFKSNASMTSLLSTAQNAATCIAAPFVMTVGARLMSCRALMFVGAILTSVSYVITAMAEDIRVLLFSYGVLQGIGSAFLIPVTLTTLGMYFNKRRGLANSLALSGASLGGLIFAPLLTATFQTFGYQGSLLIVSGIALHCCISAALSRPVTYYSRNSTKQKHLEKTTKDDPEKFIHFSKERIAGRITGTVCNNKNEFEKLLCDRQESSVYKQNTVLKPLHIPAFNRCTEKCPQIKCNLGCKENGVASDNLVVNNDLGGISSTRSLNVFNRLSSAKHRTFSSRSLAHSVKGSSGWIHKVLSDFSNNASLEYMCSSTVDIHFVPQSKPNVSNSAEKALVEQSGDKSDSIFSTLIKTFDFKLFKNPVFLTYQLAAAMLCPGFSLTCIYVAPHAKGLAVDDGQIAMLITVTSSIDLVSRILLGFIADKGWLRRSTMIAIAGVAIGVTSNLMMFLSNYGLLMFYSVVIGLFGGVYFALYAVVVVDYLGLDKLHSTMGFVALFHGSSNALHFYLAGLLRDISGSYILPYHLLGCLLLGGSALMYMLPWLQKRYSK